MSMATSSTGQHRGRRYRRGGRTKQQQKAMLGVFDVVAVHIDYGNRKESHSEARFVASWCKKRGIDIRVREITQYKRGVTKREEYEEKTRNIRFDEYKATFECTGAHAVIFGHHKGDVQENVISNVMKGVRVSALSGMKMVGSKAGVTIWRPLLMHPKKDIYAVAHKYGVPYFKDTTPHWSNRGRIRNELIPLLAEIYGDGFRQNLTSVAHESDELNSLLREQVFKPFRDAINQSPLAIWVECIPFMSNGVLFWKEALREICEERLGIGRISERPTLELLDALHRVVRTSKNNNNNNNNNNNKQQVGIGQDNTSASSSSLSSSRKSPIKECFLPLKKNIRFYLRGTLLVIFHPAFLGVGAEPLPPLTKPLATPPPSQHKSTSTTTTKATTTAGPNTDTQGSGVGVGGGGGGGATRSGSVSAGVGAAARGPVFIFTIIPPPRRVGGFPCSEWLLRTDSEQDHRQWMQDLSLSSIPASLVLDIENGSSSRGSTTASGGGDADDPSDNDKHDDESGDKDKQEDNLDPNAAHININENHANANPTARNKAHHARDTAAAAADAAEDDDADDDDHAHDASNANSNPHDAVWALEHTRTSIEKLKFALISYDSAIKTCVSLITLSVVQALHVAKDAMMARLDVLREQERLSRDQFNQLSMETQKSKETVKISIKLRFQKPKAEPFIKTLDQKREERALALQELEKIIGIRNSLERLARNLEVIVTHLLPSITNQQVDYLPIVNMVSEGCLVGCLDDEAIRLVEEILILLKKHDKLRNLASLKLKDARMAYSATAQRLVECVAAAWQ